MTSSKCYTCAGTWHFLVLVSSMAIATIINQKQNLLSWKILFSQTVSNNIKPFFPMVIKNLRGVKSKEMTKVTHTNFSPVSL